MNEGLLLSNVPWMALCIAMATAGLKTVQQRLSAAAERLCHKLFDARKISNSATMTECYRHTFASALLNLNTTRALAKNNQ